MVFLRTPAQTHNNALKSSAFLRSREREKEVSLSLSFFFSSVRVVVVVVVRTHRAWCVLKAKKREKKKTIRKKFFYARAKRHKNYYCKTVFDFFSLSLVLVLSGRRRRRRVPPPRERERERCAHLFKNAPRLSFRETYLCVLSLCSSFCSEYFYSFSSCREKWIKKSGLCGRFRFFDGIF